MPPLASFLRASSLVASRAFQIDTYHGLALVPFADLFNHSDSPHVHLASDHWVCSVCGALDACPHDGQQGGAVEALAATPAERAEQAADTCDMVSERYVEAGREVFNTYGPLSNAQLLASYGFMLEANEDDCLLFDVSLVCEATGREASAQGDLRDRLSTVARWLRDERGIDVAAELAANPLITSARLPDALCIDADGRLDPRFFLLLVSLMQDPTTDTSVGVHELALTSLTVARSLEAVVADVESPEAGRGQSVHADSPASVIARRVATAVVRLCDLHQGRQRSPELTAASLLDLADTLSAQASSFRWRSVSVHCVADPVAETAEAGAHLPVFALPHWRTTLA